MLKILPYEYLNEKTIRFCDGTYITLENEGEKEFIESISYTYSPIYIPKDMKETFSKLKTVGVVREITFNPSLYIVFKVTKGCNLACKYCYEWSNPEKIKESTKLEVIDAIFQNIVKDNKAKFVFHGGEPLLFLDKIIIPTIQKYYNKNIKFSIQTNGILLVNERIVKKLILLQKNFGVGVGVSIDGLKEHNFMRVFANGMESWDIVVEGIEKSIKAGLRIGSIVVVNKYSVKDMVKIVEFLYDLGIRGTRLNPLYPAGHPEIKKMIAKSEDYDRYLVKVAKWIVKHNSEVNEEDKFVVKNLSEMLEAMFGKSSSICQVAPCGAGKKFISIDYAGNINPCDHLPIDLGNVLNGFSWEKIWKNRELREFWVLAKRRLINIYNKKCGNCKYRVYCNGGGCPTFHLEMFGKEFYKRVGIYCPKRTWRFFEKLIENCNIESLSSLLDMSMVLFTGHDLR
jgi:uncharacterized protein